MRLKANAFGRGLDIGVIRLGLGIEDLAFAMSL